MRSRFIQPIWIIPLAVAVLVAGFGWWGNNRLRETIEATLRAELTVALDANVTALEIWMDNQIRLATSLADEPFLRALALDILEGVEPVPGVNDEGPRFPQLEALENYLKPRLEGVGYEVAHLVSTNAVVRASSRRAQAQLALPVSEAHLAKFFELFTMGRPVIITPFKPRSGPRHSPLLGRRPGQMDPSRLLDSSPHHPPAILSQQPPQFSPDSWRTRRGDITLMQVAAPLRDDNGVIRGALALIINPDKEFTRILSVARPGETGETYAFDQHGLMISRSRFDEQLKEVGLLENEPGVSSALTLRLADPGGNLMKGFTLNSDESATWPLIPIVARAVAGGSGVDVKPSRDYRGVPVVGAWRWLPEHGFGVATQIGADEAYRTLGMLKLLFVMLFLLLVFCANGLFLFSYFNSVWRRRLSEAELKVKQLGQYTIEEKIGEGGMGSVYRARHALMRRDTAVKLLMAGPADAASVQGFEREVRLSCQLTHPNTIQVYDYGHTPEGIFYYAMEFLRGLNLQALIVRFGPQPEGRVIRVLTQICDSLAEAHALGLVHRDIKPANIFLCHRGGIPDHVKVLDFGLVREYRDKKKSQPSPQDKAIAGTPSFMPPEAIDQSGNSDPRSDLYSVGALGYYLLTGAHVFEAESVSEMYEKHLAESPPPPSQRTTNPISAEMEETLLRCLEKEPNLRPQSAGELRSMLLTSPRALEWGPGEAASWWARYVPPSGPLNGKTDPPDSSSTATATVDLESIKINRS